MALSFYGDGGTALSLPLAATQQGTTQIVNTSTLTATIAANTTLALDTGALGTNVEGWADVRGQRSHNGLRGFPLGPAGSDQRPGRHYAVGGDGFPADPAHGVDGHRAVRQYRRLCHRARAGKSQCLTKPEPHRYVLRQ